MSGFDWLRRPCQAPVNELREMLAEKVKLADEMADEIERMCRRVKKTLDSTDVVISVEQVQDVIARRKR